MEANNYYDAKIKRIDRISTGSKNLDDILGGGIETKALTDSMVKLVLARHRCVIPYV